jgi:lipopolysaccharide/colanic/teichoic acid biosynthesis glycosyltransferase
MEKRKFRIITLIADIVILTISFFAVMWTKPGNLKGYLPSHLTFFLGLAAVWIIISLWNGKMHRGKIVNFTTLFIRVITSNVSAVSVTALIMFIFRDYEYSRTVVLGTGILATALELLFGATYIAYKKAVIQDYENYENYRKYRKPSEFELVGETNGNGNGNGNGNHHETLSQVNPGIISSIENEGGPDLAAAILEMTCQRLTEKTAVLSTTTIFNIASLPREKYDYIINLHRINDILRLDDFIDAVNAKLESKGFFFCCVETKDQRKVRLLRKLPPVINWIYYCLDFIVKRVLPKLRFTTSLYYFLTRGSNAVISRAEALGRISRAGFSIRQESFIGNQLCIEAVKMCEPLKHNENRYGPIIALPRIGKNGVIFKAYKMRTMHPYSEYIQDYVYNLYDLKKGGKFRNDFRITSWGSVARKIWLDELPMLINWFRGDMKLVGVRPLSRHYFELYNNELRLRRIKYKPGLIPPFYADMPGNLEEIQSSEMKYLDAYEKHPFLTDLRYFWKSWWNILFRKARSQ